MFRHVARKIKIADVIQFSYQLALKWGDYILDQPGRTKVIARNVKKKGRQENQGQPAGCEEGRATGQRSRWPLESGILPWSRHRVPEPC